MSRYVVLQGRLDLKADVKNAVRIAKAFDNLDARDEIKFKCAACGHPVALHYAGTPHFEHYPNNPERCRPLSQPLPKRG